MKIPKVKFVFDRKHLSSKIKEGKIDLRISHVKKQKFLAAGLSVYPHQWYEKEQLIRNALDAIEKNAILAHLMRTFNNSLL